MAVDILVVDDAQIERHLIQGMLSKNPNYRIVLANNGEQAVEQITSHAFDLVVTDLFMPEMDGLELLRTIRQTHPEIPVILMTAYGDELTAVEALESGAASYVPKARKAERLMLTVERVLERAAANRSRRHLERSMLEYHCRFALKNERQLIRALVSRIQQVMAGIGFADTVERIRTGEALEEALLNAMYHGNLEIGRQDLAATRGELDEQLLDDMIADRCREPHIRDRKILVIVRLTNDEARFVIRDEGRGFGAMFSGTEEKPGRFESGDDRGLTLIHSLMDEVLFNQAGNELVLYKRHLCSAVGQPDG